MLILSEYTILVYTNLVNMLKNITLSADMELIKRAREKAKKEKTTLNDRFREWLRRYTHSGYKVNAYDDLMNKLDYAQPGKRFSRDELNER